MSSQGVAQGGSNSYLVDLVMCIDATASMSPIINTVKTHALSFYTEVTNALSQKQKRIDRLRVKVVVFRDFHHDGEHAMSLSPFYNLPEQGAELASFVSAISAHGGGDDPESGLEALATAINSDWEKGGDRRRHLVALWTDTSAHRLEDASSQQTPGYPAGMPASFDEITALWEGQRMELSAKRLMLFAPDAYPWNDIQGSWENVVHISSKAGQGLKDVHFEQVLNLIANSI